MKTLNEFIELHTVTGQIHVPHVGSVLWDVPLHMDTTHGISEFIASSAG